MRPLIELRAGETGHVVTVTGDAALAQRLAEFGLFEGETVMLVGHAPLGDPLEIQVGSTHLSIRRQDARHVLLSPPVPGS
jgi:Fe2+ transport system protein FeoA